MCSLCWEEEGCITVLFGRRRRYRSREEGGREVKDGGEIEAGGKVRGST